MRSFPKVAKREKERNDEKEENFRSSPSWRRIVNRSRWKIIGRLLAVSRVQVLLVKKEKDVAHTHTQSLVSCFVSWSLQSADHLPSERSHVSTAPCKVRH